MVDSYIAVCFDPGIDRMVITIKDQDGRCSNGNRPGL